MKKIILCLLLAVSQHAWSQKPPEKPTAIKVYEIDSYVDRCFDFYFNAHDLNMKVKAIDAQIATGSLDKDAVLRKQDELKRYLETAKEQERMGQELLAQASTMPDKVQVVVKTNPLKSPKALKNTTKATEVVKDGVKENVEAVENIPKVLARIKN